MGTVLELRPLAAMPQAPVLFEMIGGLS